MFSYVLIVLVIPITYANCFLDSIEEYFVNENVTQAEDDNCRPFTNQQYYYFQAGNATKSSKATKIECLHKDIPNDIYFPKCCPPGFLYHSRHHKCVSNNVTDNYSYLGNKNLLIRTDLINCTVLLDHVIPKLNSKLTIYSQRYLYHNAKLYDLGKYCLDYLQDDDDHFVIRTCEDFHVCRNKGVRCIKKCCPDGQYFKGTKCYPGSEFGLSLENSTRFKDLNENYNAIMTSKPCKRYIGSPEYNYYITENGTTVVQEMGEWKQYALEETYYCMEYVEFENKHEILLCMTHKGVPTSYTAKGILTLCSCVGLFLTIIGYFILPDLKNLIGNIVITYSTCLLMAFILLTYLHFSPYHAELCVPFGFTIAFAFLASFTWMTILSYEVWRVLGSMVTDRSQHMHGKRRRYFNYAIVGLVFPCAILTMNFFDYKFNIFPEPVHLVVGKGKCVYENQPSKGMYGFIFQFALPCGLLLLINLVIFVKTVTYILQVKRDIGKMKIVDTNTKNKRWKTFTAEKEKIAMVLKLFLLMGVNWLYELCSSVVNFPTSGTLSTVGTIFDCFNALQGVFIFCIFMMKKKILKSLLKILKIQRTRRSSEATMSTEVVTLPAGKTS